MIRPVTDNDVDAIITIAIGSELFPAEAADFLRDSVQRWQKAGQSPGQWVVDEHEGRVAAVAFFEPREATEGCWYLTMLAVHPERQRAGHGARLIAWVEAELRSSGARLLLIETSGTAQYDGTRRFYARQGFAEVARVPDYFCDGDDMVLFHKDLRKSA